LFYLQFNLINGGVSCTDDHHAGGKYIVCRRGRIGGGKLGDRYGFHSDHGASYLGMTSYGSADWSGYCCHLCRSSYPATKMFNFRRRSGRCHCYSPSSSSPPTTRRTVGVFSGVCGHAWRDDLRCGEDNSSPPKIFLAPNGETAQCDPNGEAPCCYNGFCMKLEGVHAACNCIGERIPCVNYAA